MISTSQVSWEKTSTFYACALVCRSWLDRSRLYLYKDIDIWADRIWKFQATLKSNPSVLLSSTNRIVVSGTPISALFAMSRFEELKYLEIMGLNLTNEHSVITRGPLARSVTRLQLQSLFSCTVSTLLRFLNSFKCLIDLSIHHVRDAHLKHNGQSIPMLPPKKSRSLEYLRFSVVPGISKLIEWYIHKGFFLASLKTLFFDWELHSPPEKDAIHCMLSLLDHCTNTLEDLTLWINLKQSSSPDEISKISMFWCLHPWDLV